MDFVRIVVFLVCLFWKADAQLDTKVCQEVKYNYGYFPPDSPFSFKIKYRQTDFMANVSTLEEIHFDAANHRQLQISTKSGVTKRTIKNFRDKTQITLIEIYIDRDNTNSHCMLSTLHGDKWSIGNGLKLLKYGRVPFKQQLNNKQKIRNVPVTFFTGCDYQKASLSEITANVTYAWTLEYGNYGNAFQQNQPYFSSFHGMEKFKFKAPVAISFHNEIFWYEEDPLFKDEDFSIPPGYFCKSDFRDDSHFAPSISLQSHFVRSEIVTDEYVNGQLRQAMYQVKTWVSLQFNLLKLKYFTGSSTNFPYPQSNVESVQDLNAGIAYVANLDKNLCQVVPLSRFKGSPYIIDRGGFYSLDGLKAILQKYQWTHKITETYRNIPVDIWMSNMDVENFIKGQSTINGRPVNTFLEVAFLNKQWTEYQYNGQKLRRDFPIRFKKQVVFEDGKQPQTNFTTTTNFFDVIEGEPDLTDFIVQNCFIKTPRTSFQFKMNSKTVLSEDLVFGSLGTFQYSIADYIAVDILRIQVLYVGVSMKTCTVYGLIYEPQQVIGGAPDTYNQLPTVKIISSLKELINLKLLTVSLKPPGAISSPIRLKPIVGSLSTQNMTTGG